MNAPALPPTAPTTLVIMLGASALPNSPGFQASEAFTHAAQGFKHYMLDPQGFGLPATNLLDLFDAQAGASDQLEQLGSFLKERTQALKAANQVVRDVLVYFVGHGGFVISSQDFYLLPRRSDASSLRASGIAIDALAEVLREKARQTRRYLFLDCCFAAAAFRAFQGGPDQAAITKTLDAFAVRARSRGFPRKGTVLLCSSDQKTPSLLLPDESCTMFSYALLDVLKNGNLHRPPQLSLRDLKELAEDRLAALPEQNAPRPGLHSPDQSEGDVADVPFFPNPSVERERARLAEEERRRQTEQAEQKRLVEAEKRRQLEEERRRQAEEEHVRKAREEQARQAEEERRRLAEEAERARLARQERIRNVKEQPTLMPSQSFPPPTPSHAAVPPQGPVPQSSAMLPPLPPEHPQWRRSPAIVAVLILLTLLLVGGGSLGIYGAATGRWLWNPSHGASTPISLGTTVRATATSTPRADTSVLGKIWHTQHSGTSQWLYGVAWSGSLFAVVGDSGTILTSRDGRAWTRQNSSTSQRLYGVAWSGTQLVAVGTNGTILTSPDGRAWSAQHSGTSQWLYGVAWSGSLFAVVGDSGTILTSANGTTWTAQNYGSSESLEQVAWSGTQFVVVGNSGAIFTSPNGRAWSAQHSGTSELLLDVAWSGTQLVAVGKNGTILTSP